MKYSSDVEAAEAMKVAYDKIRSEIGNVIIGQDEVVKGLLTAIFCQGHCLLVGVPGLAKTLLIQTIASSLDLNFNRIQFTPDLMPSDILGSETLDQNRNFKFIKGPVFANIILADEINRTPPKTQSALLEAMQEYSVTIAGAKHALERPFFVLATQNPIEQEGTYPLPEAQLDRFMFMIQLDYPSYAEEVNIVKNTTNDVRYQVKKVVTSEEIMDFQHLVRRVPVTDHVIEYAVKLVHKTRPAAGLAVKDTNDYLDWGAGPRASQALILAAKCNALLSGKYSPDIEDVKAVALPVLRHRIIRNFKAEAEGISVDDIIARLV
ncbi:MULTISPECIES: MoxR family ATPase [Dyadobacter]|uniref:MoxR family ATPase n=1 Tax=Dyadobacter chenhuakuii TaxID=2909339 RepID=A0A9X1TSH7_9BACT|nr:MULTISPECIES: MoxR family ATPase [Dyadobacter]MCE7072029.1 MoxR family ATPase [Dyadobacter sp. CY327]MCF2494992.1 MoxR family ATPase [Dyadobacter chenhuakuii]MCF2498070.1 MoxR family ATPase [Dyadobacter chenhuakuii]MCF2518929.1 MoxR family ATPase [Dyadobacter sp. CY351]USJ31694.1 MoxR family ATPase [Dyadobacter chenhuakuii]